MTLEKEFASFVRWFGGELVSDLLPSSRADAPKNADYFLFGRSVIAELKCLEENYFNAQRLNAKFTELINEWMRNGILRSEHIKNAKFSTNDLPPQCALHVMDIFSKSLKKAVEHANLQIKQTKAHFGLPEAKGLLILANDGNFSLNPKFSMQILARLFRDHFSSIDSFIYFAPRLKAHKPGAPKVNRVWISGPCHDRKSGVAPELLGQISRGWNDFLEAHFNYRIESQVVEDHALLDDIEFQRS